MSGFTKLVPEIIQSSIWNESAEVRCVWITMLATKDATGYVRGDCKTLARLANVDIQYVEEAIRKFQEPDPSSHTPANEGRRIEPAAGGWMVLNHELYRSGDDSRREYMREYMRRWRAGSCKPNSNPTVNLPSASVSVNVVEGGVGEGVDVNNDLPPLDEEQSKQAAALFVQALERFGLTPLDINCNRIRANITELLMRGYTFEQVEEVLAWAKSPKARKGTPQSAVSATDPVKFGQWLTTMENHDKENEIDKRRAKR